MSKGSFFKLLLLLGLFLFGPLLSSIFSISSISSILLPERQRFSLRGEIWAQGNENRREIFGLGDVTWGIAFEDARQKLVHLASAEKSEEKVEIQNILHNRYIEVKRNDTVYRYNFYKTPYNVARLRNRELSREQHEQEEALLFHVRLRTAFIRSELLKEKMEQIYGASSSSSVNDKGYGVNSWRTGRGMIFLWYEPYQGEAFTRTIDYMSVELTEKIMAEYRDFFDAEEKLLIQNLLLR